LKKTSSLAAEIPASGRKQRASEAAAEAAAITGGTASPVPKLNLENQTLDGEITESES